MMVFIEVIFADCHYSMCEQIIFSVVFKAVSITERIIFKNNKHVNIGDAGNRNTAELVNRFHIIVSCKVLSDSAYSSIVCASLNINRPLNVMQLHSVFYVLILKSSAA